MERLVGCVFRKLESVMSELLAYLLDKRHIDILTHPSAKA